MISQYSRACFRFFACIPVCLFVHLIIVQCTHLIIFVIAKSRFFNLLVICNFDSIVQGVLTAKYNAFQTVYRLQYDGMSPIELATIFHTIIIIIIIINLYIYPPDSQESDGGAIHRVSNYPDLLPEMPRYCCPLVS